MDKRAAAGAALTCRTCSKGNLPPQNKHTFLKFPKVYCLGRKIPDTGKEAKRQLPTKFFAPRSFKKAGNSGKQRNHREVRPC